AELNYLRLRDLLRPVLQDDEGLDCLPPVCVNDPNRGRVLDLRVLEENLLHLPWIDLETADVNHVFLSVDDVKVSVVVHLGDVSCQEPSISQDHLCLLILIPVALHHLGPSYRELPDLPRREKFLGIVRV